MSDKGDSMACYASIIIPTHDRAATLPYSLQSAICQSVRDIEILIVGDGCTPEVREVAISFATKDHRIRFLDRPKTPFHGVASRHLAVQSAQSERIFYNDDDDLLLPKHVEVLGGALDDADVVDTPPISVQQDGLVALGMHDSAHPLMRKMLIDETYKGVFDTHLAHRKSVYGDAWMQTTDSRVFLHVLQHFAGNPNIVWKTEQRITALSFHGMCRFGMPGRERAEELAVWERRISDPHLERQLRQSGSYVFHSSRLLHALNKADRVDSNAFAARLLDHMDSDLHPSETQRGAIRAVRSIVCGIKPEESGALRALDDLLDARLGPNFRTANVVAVFLRVFPPETVLGFLSSCRKRPCVSLARFHVGVQTGQIDREDIDAVTAAIEDTSPWARFFFGVSIGEGFLRMGDLEKSWECTNELLPNVPQSMHALPFWHLRRKVASRTGRVFEAKLARKCVQEAKERMT